jgi:hypothetical protein
MEVSKTAQRVRFLVMKIVQELKARRDQEMEERTVPEQDSKIHKTKGQL